MSQEELEKQNAALKEELLDLQRRHLKLQEDYIQLQRDAYDGILKKQRRSRRPLEDGERERIMERARAGDHPKEIAAELRRSTSTVRHVIWLARQQGHLPPHPEEGE